MPPVAPQYQRVADDIRARIRAGEFPPGARLPPWRTLTEHYRVGYGVIADAIALLRTEGIVVSSQRASVRVADPARVSLLTDVDEPWPHKRGETRPGTVEAGQELARRLDIAPGTVVRWQREELLGADDRPSHLRTTYRRPRTRRQAVRTVDARVRGRMLTPGEAAHLGLAVGMALVVTAGRVDAAGGPVGMLELVLPADRWQVALQ